MNHIKLSGLLAGLCAVCVGIAHAQPSTQALPSAQPLARVILVGDSTMAPRSGYGDALCKLLKPGVECLNLAKGGRSSGSYRAEGSWAVVMAHLQQGRSHATQPPVVPTWVLLQFGHNDQPGKPGRSTDLATEYPVNLAAYVREVRQWGAMPVLVTPLTRRTFKDGRLENNLLPWSLSMQQVAQENTVPLIDLNAMSYAAVQAMGQEVADTLAMEPPPSKALAIVASAPSVGTVEVQGAAKSAFDRTHVGVKGAELFARMVASQGLKLDTLAPYFSP
ncbi:MAG: hydrolase [Burkholderiales bacterium PBB4]|nr:MAG: hydrolase [Burkholderiales bacterium PBB4]